MISVAVRTYNLYATFFRRAALAFPPPPYRTTSSRSQSLLREGLLSFELPPPTLFRPPSRLFMSAAAEETSNDAESQISAPSRGHLFPSSDEIYRRRADDGRALHIPPTSVFLAPSHHPREHQVTNPRTVASAERD